MKQKTAVITGASDGIGAALTTLLIKNGWKVIGISRNYNKLEALSKNLLLYEGTFNYFLCDVQDFTKLKTIAKKIGSTELVAKASPDVFNHNLETVPRLYRKIRPGARYYTSLRLLERVKEINADVFTKSGIMVGLGEEKDEVIQVMDDLRSANVDFLTIGQYLQPTLRHAEVQNFLSPEDFHNFKVQATARGFTMVSATPLTRSSYHADEDFRMLKEKAKIKKQLNS